jgi:DNA-binding beta-propeller fold protein YncE
VALVLWLAAPAAARAAGAVYASNIGGANVSQFAIGGAGVLSPLSPATVATGGQPFGMAVTPGGRSVYVANQNGTVSQFDVNPLTGALSPKSPATVASQGGSNFVAVTP